MDGRPGPSVGFLQFLPLLLGECASYYFIYNKHTQIALLGFSKLIFNSNSNIYMTCSSYSGRNMKTEMWMI